MWVWSTIHEKHILHVLLKPGNGLALMKCILSKTMNWVRWAHEDVEFTVSRTVSQQLSVRLSPSAPSQLLLIPDRKGVSEDKMRSCCIDIILRDLGSEKMSSIKEQQATEWMTQSEVQIIVFIWSAQYVYSAHVGQFKAHVNLWHKVLNWRTSTKRSWNRT